jgi:hypothetical protein
MFPFALHKVCTRLSYSPIPNSLPQLLYNFPIMNLKMDYGRHGLNLTLPDSAEVSLRVTQHPSRTKPTLSGMSCAKNN